MASSYVQQVPTVMWVLGQLKPTTMLDIGKGFGKYAFLAHEYLGIPRDQRPDPTKTLADQSQLTIDAVEIQPDYLWPHIPQLYRNVVVGDITEIYSQFSGYDVVLIADVIEHLTKDQGVEVLQHFVADGSALVISTPKRFFSQDVLQSEWEQHRSFWTPDDFRKIAAFVDWQTIGPGRVYVLAAARREIFGFGNRPVRRARRLVRLVLSDF